MQHEARSYIGKHHSRSVGGFVPASLLRETGTFYFAGKR
jgi:hypothetical protein